MLYDRLQKILLHEYWFPLINRWVAKRAFSSRRFYCETVSKMVSSIAVKKAVVVAIESEHYSFVIDRLSTAPNYLF